MFISLCGHQQAGFQMTLENGWIVSIMFGLGSYGSNRWEWEDDSLDWNDKFKHAEARGRSAELWAFHSTYDMNTEHLHETKEEADNYRLSNHYPEEPIGYQNTSDTLKFINHVSNLPLPATRLLGYEAKTNHRARTMNHYEKLEWIHSQVQEIQNGIEMYEFIDDVKGTIDFDLMYEFIEDVREYLHRKKTDTKKED